MDPEARRRFQERFLERLKRRQSSEVAAEYEARVRPARAGGPTLESAGNFDMVLETIVNEERPVLFVDGERFNAAEVTLIGHEARTLVDKLSRAINDIGPVLRLVGRIDVENFPGNEFIGTGWFVAPDIVVTNRHVAELVARHDGRRFVFGRGMGNRDYAASLCNAHEFDDLPPDPSQIIKISEVLYIEPASQPYDIAFVRVERPLDGVRRPYIEIAPADIGDDDVPICVVGYPARASKKIIPNQDLMERLYRSKYDVKRIAPGYGMAASSEYSEHDCTTLGGNSGSVLLNFKGQSVGLHFAGLYQEANYAVPASILREYISGKRWNDPVRIVTSNRPEAAGGSIPAPSGAAPQAIAPAASAAAGGAVSVTIPLTITVSLGTPTFVSAAGIPGATAPPTISPGLKPVDIVHPVEQIAQVESAAEAYWKERPQGVIAVRVGFLEEGESIGDHPCLALSVDPRQLAEFVTSGATDFQGVPIRYFSAAVEEQIEALPQLESVDTIAYDDDARQGDKFSFAAVHEQMEVILHVGPEYSWDVLEAFLSEANGEIVSAMYEFHATHIMKALETRLDDGASLKLVLDNATFSGEPDSDEEFEPDEVLERWAEDYNFEYVVAPEGRNGLISDSYHIKVTVRSDNVFWLSSGNWKPGSSQPIVTQDQRDEVPVRDLPGNREWHVVVDNKTLAKRFRNHIKQDFKRSEALRNQEIQPENPLEKIFVYAPVTEIQTESIFLERRPPNEVIKPETLGRRRFKVRPLLTPDREGAVFAEAVLELIESAEESLLFQIPYISMPPTPRANRGYIDQLIKALSKKLKTLGDARVILRTGGKRFSSPTHAGWYFKSKGVNIAEQLRVMENHHTKGMIVDGKHTLIGSHNWSKPGVSLNRDASLIFNDDEEVAAYFTRAFDVDWERANPVRPRRAETAARVVESAAVSSSNYRRISVAEWLNED